MLVLAWSGVTGSAFAFPSTTNNPGYALIQSRQTFELAPESEHYVKWAAWIKQRNEAMTKAGDKSLASVGVGQITITVEAPARPENDEVGVLTVGSPVPNGPPLALSAKGEDGEKIRIVNRTPDIRQTWLYEWHQVAGGNDGWDSISYGASYCVTAHEAGKLCSNNLN